MPVAYVLCRSSRRGRWALLSRVCRLLARADTSVTAVSAAALTRRRRHTAAPPCMRARAHTQRLAGPRTHTDAHRRAQAHAVAACMHGCLMHAHAACFRYANSSTAFSDDQASCRRSPSTCLPPFALRYYLRYLHA
eukprot:6200003-Pleurochrysis_carterae.AAC.1